MELNIILFLLVLISAFCLGTMYNLYQLWVKYDELEALYTALAANTRGVINATLRGQEELTRRVEHLEIKNKEVW